MTTVDELEEGTMKMVVINNHEYMLARIEITIIVPIIDATYGRKSLPG